MSSLVVCPECQRKLKVPDTAVGKTIRCPACKVVIPSVPQARANASAPESSESDNPAPSRLITASPAPRTAPTLSRRQPLQEEEPEDDVEPVEENPRREKSSRKRRPIRKKSSAGLMIGLVAGAVVLMVVLLGGGATLIWHFARTRGSSISQTEWQTFSPPNGNCSVLMPGTPQSQPVTTLGVTVNKYLVTRMKENAFFAVAFANLGPDPLQPNALELVANAERDHLVRTLNCNVSSETAITLGDLPGREFQLTTQPQGTLVDRIYLAKVGGIHRLYIVAAAGDHLKANSPDITRFFDSFRIEGGAQPPTYLDAAAPPAQLNLPPFVHPPQPNPPGNPPQPFFRPRPPFGPFRQR